MPMYNGKEYKRNKKGVFRQAEVIIDFQGNKHQIDVTSKDFDAFIQKLEKLHYDIKYGIIAINSNSTVEKWAYEWLETYKTDIKDKQQSRYKGVIKNYICPKIGQMPLKDVKQHHIRQVLNECSGMSKSHISTVYNTLNGIFTKAVGSDLIIKNPCIGVDKPKGTEGELRSLTSYEEKIFLKVAKKHPKGMMFKMILKCGLRPGEVRALDVAYINIKNHEIKVKEAVESGNKKIKGTKTEKERIVPIPADYEKELMEIMPKSGLLFPSSGTGKVITEQNFRRAWRSFKRLMNIEAGAKVYRNEVIEPIIDEDLSPYYLRHTYCTHLAEQGIDIRVAQYLMGHQDIKVTANIYTHVANSKMLNDAKAKIRGNKLGIKKMRVKNINKIVGLDN